MVGLARRGGDLGLRAGAGLGGAGDAPRMKPSSGMKKLAAQSPTSTSSFRNQNLRGSEMQDGSAQQPRQPPAPSPVCTRCGAERGSLCWSAH